MSDDVNTPPVCRRNTLRVRADVWHATARAVSKCLGTSECVFLNGPIFRPPESQPRPERSRPNSVSRGESATRGAVPGSTVPPLRACSNMSSARRPASARPRTVERWTGDMETAHHEETPAGYTRHYRHFASVPWRELNTRTRALQAHEFVNPVGYVVREKHKYINPPFYLEKEQVLQADEAVREANEPEYRHKRDAELRRVRDDIRLRDQLTKTKTLRKSKKIEAVTEELVRPHKFDERTGKLEQRSGEYQRLGTRERQMTFTGVGNTNQNGKPVAIEYSVSRDDKKMTEKWDNELNATDREHQKARAVAKPRAKTQPPVPPVSSFTFAERTADPVERAMTEQTRLNAHRPTKTRPVSAPAVRPQKVTPGERVLQIHGPQNSAQRRIATKKTRSARGGLLAAKMQSFGYSFGGEAEDTHEHDLGQSQSRVLKPPPGPIFAARTATVEERMQTLAMRRPASARAMLRVNNRGASSLLASQRISTPADGRVTQNYPILDIPDRSASERPVSRASPRPQTARVINSTRPNSTRPEMSIREESESPKTDVVRQAYMASSLQELELGHRGEHGPGAFVFGHNTKTNKSLQEMEQVHKFGEFARGYDKHEGAWASFEKLEPRRKPTWR